ncbi:hypothetical protein [Mycolicibacterium sp. CBMA 295]|uniref:hypothetical protein n=1 Tax=Mycolicibacterium sp. CBMA 295 TaxID=2606605 RepID=UPI00192E3D33|nr:hypothetical protein [Mycolicibacterium sp. CBMA 295]
MDIQLVAAANSYPFDWPAFWDYLMNPSSLIVKGLVLTVIIAIISQVLGVLIGLAAAPGLRDLRTDSGRYLRALSERGRLYGRDRQGRN